MFGQCMGPTEVTTRVDRLCRRTGNRYKWPLTKSGPWFVLEIGSGGWVVSTILADSQPRQPLTVHLASVSYFHYQNPQDFILKVADDSIISNSVTP